MLAFALTAWNWLTPRMLLVGAFVVLCLGLLLGARHSGRQAERVENITRSLKTYESANKIRHEVDGLSDSDVRRRLREYAR